MRRRWIAVMIAGATAACTRDRPHEEPRVIAPDPITFAGDRSTASPTRKPDVIYVPTPEPVVKRMLEMAGVGPNDVVYDLGCGDGRIVVAAARDYGARGVCVEIDPQRIAEARKNIAEAGVEEKVEIRQADLFEVDTSPATVVTLYLLDSLNLKLRPKLQRELRPGARIVSQSFSMGDWKPVRQEQVDGKPVYLWTIQKKR